MKKFDAHVHDMFFQKECADSALLIQRLQNAGLDGAVILSRHPPILEGVPVTSARERMDAVLRCTREEPNLIPFYFVDAISPEASTEIDLAIELGFQGFKVMCACHNPCDERAMMIYEKIAQHNKPILFHSGILFDGRNASSKYNRPTMFEELLSIDGLRFALAHASWPWTDECIALFGKYNSSLRLGEPFSAKSEMFIDLTPGTPRVYRKDFLTKLLGCDFGIEKNLLWGSDCQAGNYSSSYARDILTFDEMLLESLEISKEVMEDIFSGNMMRFLYGHR